jgi:hypothetical protein
MVKRAYIFKNRLGMIDQVVTEVRALSSPNYLFDREKRIEK